jgi:hypothetical protein
MARSQILRLRGIQFAAALAISFLTFGGRAEAQIPTSPSSPARTPAASVAEIFNAVEPPVEIPGLTSVPQPSYNPGPGAATTAARVELRIFDTITESIFGEPDPAQREHADQPARHRSDLDLA